MLKKQWFEQIETLIFPRNTTQTQVGISIWNKSKVSNFGHLQTRQTLDIEHTKLRAMQQKQIPHCLKCGVWYSITAMNPMNENKSQEFNTMANEQLLSDLKKWSDKNLIDSIITSKGGDEIGYTVQFLKSSPEDGDANMKELAKKYKQMAIFKYHNDIDTHLLKRSVVACFPEYSHVESSGFVEVVFSDFQYTHHKL
ncbi:hypothetical protein RFI_06047 [Reticulomyxa filosa]|uniref:Uncharacterized protein n=1 Tax=Reticulomyxa filosa TaxID=46433 RepID=X6NYW0_RETFI|nr:hypothetical protein RFI_06047 [Reticulomyxa filosa]|eukprot:ETO31073.1 hypothetical protein RFI_06047 [Reticulomyxa filosa]